jgi:uncharacterized membrane protein YvbJ
MRPVTRSLLFSVWLQANKGAKMQVKLCPQCSQQAALDAAFCAKCGHQYRTKFISLPNQTQVVNTLPSFQHPQLTNTLLADLAQQYRDSKKLYTWTLIAGICLLWPALIVTYLEHNKMKEIKAKVASQGIDAETWVRSL